MVAMGALILPLVLELKLVPVLVLGLAPVLRLALVRELVPVLVPGMILVPPEQER